LGLGQTYASNSDIAALGSVRSLINDTAMTDVSSMGCFVPSSSEWVMTPALAE
jgi:hypothetical protein